MTYPDMRECSTANELKALADKYPPAVRIGDTKIVAAGRDAGGWWLRLTGGKPTHCKTVVLVHICPAHALARRNISTSTNTFRGARGTTPHQALYVCCPCTCI